MSSEQPGRQPEAEGSHEQETEAEPEVLVAEVPSIPSVASSVEENAPKKEANLI